MKWFIPAKTFLLGEYASIIGGSAIVLTTKPYFQLTLTSTTHPSDIHPSSPAGILWKKNSSQYSLSWHDPYQGQGGLGASSAQFLGAYLADCFLHHKKACLEDMLRIYYNCAWAGKGLKPSGYDVLAQAHYGCVYINQQKNIIQENPWPFVNLSFFLIHTGVKLATHHHLQNSVLPNCIHNLSLLTDKAKAAFEQRNTESLIESINSYHAQLSHLNLVATHSLKIIKNLQENPEVEAIKGCGALGADILLIITTKKNASIFHQKLISQNYTVIATERELCKSSQLSFF